MSWTKVEHIGTHPNMDTCPPDGVLIDMLRVQTQLGDGINRWIYLTGECRRFWDEQYGCENAIVHAPEGETIYAEVQESPGDPTESGIYWRLADAGECATVEA